VIIIERNFASLYRRRSKVLLFLSLIPGQLPSPVLGEGVGVRVAPLAHPGTKAPLPLSLTLTLTLSLRERKISPSPVLGEGQGVR
jgi:hypothetical protein